ncbi:MAG: translation initiation factor IF-2 [Clostridia bacterium]|jgi:translation initiation factor IF-2|nr:translation initiation factor IF-2 [Clostridia bacterium]
MGVKLLGKIKIHEIAKKLNLTSKEIIEIANKLGIEVKNHLSAVEQKVAEKIEESFKNLKNQKLEKPTEKKSKNDTPVIIRREVIITDEEVVKKQEEKRKNERKKEVGFLERNNNKDFNIVYRNKPTKPMTVSELFGLNNKKEEKTEQNIEIKETINIEQKEEEHQKIEEKIEKEESVKIIEEQPKSKKQNNIKNNTYNNSEKKTNFQDTKYNNQKSNNYKNNNVVRNFGDNRNDNVGYNQRNNNAYRNNKNFNNMQNGAYNKQKNNNYKNNNEGYTKRPLDEKGIEKNIKNIMTEVVEKDIVREYNKSIDKQKQNRFEENKANKKSNTKQKKSAKFEINEDKLKTLKQTDKLSNMFNEQDGGMLDFYDLTTQRGRKNKKRVTKSEERVKQKIFQLTEIVIPDPITVKDFAMEMKKTSGEVIKKLLNYGVLATINNEIDFDTAFLIAEEFGIKAIKKETITEEDILFDETEDTQEELKERPPVVVVMGHVDHGKTSLLDAVRQTNVIQGEAGGITQHIGAYKVKINDREITFLDTPGHEAFTSMRARGAQITDIAILVVAANDGVMPQTIEAINHAKAAEIPIIVALNKIDVEGANPEKVKQELTKYDLVPEEWGGDTIFVEISAKKRINIDGLLEMVLLVADMKELKANPNKQSKGIVIEAKLDKSRGPVATMLIQRGTLDVGDTIVVGSVIGRIRAMTDDKGKKVKKAGPSTPVEVIGLTEVPEAGDTFYEVKDEKTAKHLIERRKRQEREKTINATAKVTLNDLFSQIEKGNLKQLNLIVKADVQGSVEAVKQSLEKLSNEEVEVKVIHSNVGGVTESDVTLAKVSNAIIIAFNVRPDAIARDMAKKDEVEIKQYSVIYQAIEDVEAAMKGMLDPVFEEKVIGNAEVRQTFKVSNVGTIAGAYVTEGKVSRNAGIRVIRENVVIHDGKLVSLKRFKDDAKEVNYGYECGLQIENYNDIKEGDILEIYIMEEVKK